MLAHYQNVATFAENFRSVSVQICALEIDKTYSYYLLIMATDNKKRRLITSFHNLTAEQQAED